MNLYKLEQDVNNGYDTYDSCIVAAKTAKQAKSMHPDYGNDYGKSETRKDDWDSDWAKNEDYVKCTYIGRAKKGTKKSVICASFRAG